MVGVKTWRNREMSFEGGREKVEHSIAVQTSSLVTADWEYSKYFKANRKLEIPIYIPHSILCSWIFAKKLPIYSMKNSKNIGIKGTGKKWKWVNSIIFR